MSRCDSRHATRQLFRLAQDWTRGPPLRNITRLTPIGRRLIGEALVSGNCTPRWYSTSQAQRQPAHSDHVTSHESHAGSRRGISPPETPGPNSRNAKFPLRQPPSNAGQGGLFHKWHLQGRGTSLHGRGRLTHIRPEWQGTKAILSLKPDSSHCVFTMYASLSLLPLLSVLAHGYANPGACSGACNLHDPGLIQRASDGRYFRFSTGNKISYASASSIEGPWEVLGSVLPDGSSIDLEGWDDLWVCSLHSQPIYITHP